MIYKQTQLFILLIVLLLIGGCSTAPFRHVVPKQHQDNVKVEGINNHIRFWGDTVPEHIDELMRKSNEQILKSQPGKDALNILALSGGAEDGAFGAGLLTGWSVEGTRPNFDVVTGVSIGALIAPFAFLGPDYDHQLEMFFTTLATDDLLVTDIWRQILAVSGASAFADSTPLANLIKRFVTAELMAKINAEHQKGRRLFIGTTNLDSQRPVIWNMGEIASSKHPKALDIFRDVLLASASIPGVMPPVYFNVQIGSDTYQELHVDGGVTSQVFVYPIDIRLGDYEGEIPAKRTIYVIRNSKVKPEYIATAPQALSVSKRSISTLIKNQGLGDLYKMKLIADRDRFQYRLAFIEDDFEHEALEPFDTKYMKALFKYAFSLGQVGYQWRKSPRLD